MKRRIGQKVIHDRIYANFKKVRKIVLLVAASQAFKAGLKRKTVE